MVRTINLAAASGLALLALAATPTNTSAQCEPLEATYSGEAAAGSCGSFTNTTVPELTFFRTPTLAGGHYTWQTCGSLFDTELTAFNQSDPNNFTVENDDFCGLQSQMSYIATATDYINVNLHRWPCVSTSSGLSATVGVRQNNNLLFTSSDAPICPGATRTLTATPTPIGTPARANSGNLGTYSGPGVVGSTLTAPSPGSVTVQYTFGFCSTTQAIPVYGVADAGPDSNTSTGTSNPLGANTPPTGATGLWTGPAGVTFTPSPATPGARANNLAVGPNTLTWTVTSPCSGTSIASDNVVVTRLATCGDGVIAGTEDCDLGSATNGTPGVCCDSGCNFRTSAFECRGSSGTCDTAEVCSGSSAACPTDARTPGGTVCRMAAGPCDVEERCNGIGNLCPPDGVRGATTLCQAASGDCDVDHFCDGSRTDCPLTFAPAGTICRDSTGPCDRRERCTGLERRCPSDASQPDGTACADGMVCNGDEMCMSGACSSGTAPSCDDRNACTADMCSEPGGCASSPIADCCNMDRDCSDGDVCTADMCSGAGGMCANSPITDCCVADADCDDANACTGDVCDTTTNRCMRTPIAGCCAADSDCADTNACTTDSCDVATGTCSNTAVAGCCMTAGDCDDTNTCTTDACDAATNTCTNTAVADCCLDDTECDDANTCTTDTCSTTTAMCENDAIADCCMVDSECDDMDDCTTDTCDATTSMCTNTAIAGCGGTDGGVGTDAGVPPMNDAGTPATDSGTMPGTDGGGPPIGMDAGMEMTDGGCSCRTTGTNSRAPYGLLLMLGLVVVWRRRR